MSRESGSIDWLWNEVCNSLTKQTSYLQGKILTQLEAAIPLGRQLEALGEITKDILWTQDEAIHQIVYRLFKTYIQDSGVESVAYGVKE